MSSCSNTTIGYTQDAGLINPGHRRADRRARKMGSRAQGAGHHAQYAAQQRDRAQGRADLQVRPRDRRCHADGAGEVQPLSAGSAGHAAGQPDHGLFDHRGSALLRRRRGAQFAASEPGRAHLRPGRKLSGAKVSTRSSAASTTTTSRRSPTPGRAYIQGFRHQRDLPTSTLVPKSIATKSVRGEQKTFDINKRRYPVNSTPLKETTQVEAIVEMTAQRHSRLGRRRRRPARSQSGRGHSRGQPGGDHLPGGRGLAAVGQSCGLARLGQRTGHRHHLHRALDLHQADDQRHGLRRTAAGSANPTIRRPEIISIW